MQCNNNKEVHVIQYTQALYDVSSFSSLLLLLLLPAVLLLLLLLLLVVFTDST